MLNLFIIFILLTITGTALADSDVPNVTYPRIVRHSPTVEGFVPKGWKLEQKVQGDLNADGITDYVLVIRQDHPPTVPAPENNLDDEPYESKTRMLVALFGSRTAGFDLALEDHALIPMHDTPTIDDPFDSIAITKGSLRVSIHFFANIGGWGTATTRFTFRYRNDCFQLVGYNRDETQRNTGETTATSINYLSRKIKVTSGSIEHDRKKTVWKNYTGRALICLERVGDGFEFDSEK